jgi:hypothetical protein
LAGLHCFTPCVRPSRTYSHANDHSDANDHSHTNDHPHTNDHSHRGTDGDTDGNSDWQS